jgi:hypothetical protein
MLKRKSFKQNGLMCREERAKLNKTPLFEFEVPTYRKRALRLEAYQKQTR